MAIVLPHQRTAVVRFLPDFQAVNFRELGALQWGQKTSNVFKTLILFGYPFLGTIWIFSTLSRKCL